jgi:signal peptidase I
MHEIMNEYISPSTESENNSPTPSNNPRLEMLKLILIAFAIVIPFRLFIAQPFIVDGASMDPTFRSGQYLIVDKVDYRFNEPARGSVLIFKYPKDPKKYFIKRVIGLPGETVSIRDGIVTIVNAENPEGFSLEEPYVEFERKDSLASFTLGESEYFVLGDNRLGSADSRVWGPVPEENIIGRPFLRVYPFSLLPGAFRANIE